MDPPRLDRADLGRSYVSEIETGRRNPTLESICRLADASEEFPARSSSALKINPARFFDES